MTRRKRMDIVLLSLLAILAILVVIILFTGDNSSNNNTDNTTADSSDSITKEDTSNNDNSQSESESDKQKLKDNINIPVLYYHSVNPSEENELIISPQKIKQQLQYLKDNGYTTITMKEYIDYLTNNKPLPEKSVLLTFDDGYMDNYTYLFPILKELNMKATIFVITSGIDGGYYLSSKQILEMQKYGIDFGSHTVDHSYLAQLNDDLITYQLEKSRDKLKRLLKTDVTSIAFPFGNYDQRCIEAAKKAGYKVAFTTTYGTTNKSSDLYQLQRVYVSSEYSFDKFKEKFNGAK